MYILASSSYYSLLVQEASRLMPTADTLGLLSKQWSDAMYLPDGTNLPVDKVRDYNSKAIVLSQQVGAACLPPGAHGNQSL